MILGLVDGPVPEPAHVRAVLLLRRNERQRHCPRPWTQRGTVKSRLNYAKGHPRRCGGTSAGRQALQRQPHSAAEVYFLRQEAAASPS